MPRDSVGASSRRTFLRICFLSGLSFVEFPRMNQTSVVPKASGALIEADLVVRNATIYDGTGKPGFLGHVAIKSGRIAAIGRFGTVGRPLVIDANGLVLSPGFIDLDPGPGAAPYQMNCLKQGVTTITTLSADDLKSEAVSHNCLWVNITPWDDAPDMRALEIRDPETLRALRDLFRAPPTKRLHLRGLTGGDAIGLLDEVAKARLQGRKVTVGQTPYTEELSTVELRFVFRQPYVATVSGGRPEAFITRIGDYAFHKNAQPLADAIRSCTAVPAEILNISERGYVKPGYHADLVVFDPKPSQRDQAVHHVILNGQLVVHHGSITQQQAGRILRHPLRSSSSR